MSRFFATGGSDSESESSISEDEVPVKSVVAAKAMQWSDEEEETKRVVRSARDKRFDDIQSIIKVLTNHKKIKDMANIQDDFDNLSKAFEKAKKVLDREGEKTPRFYIRALAELDTFVTECWDDREGRKNMSKNNAKALTTLRQRLRRYARDFEKDITEYKENPDEGDVVESDEGSGAESDAASEQGDAAEASEDDEPVTKSVKFLKTAEGDDDDDDEDSDFWGADSSSSESDDEEGKFTGQLTADYFRKKTTTDTMGDDKAVRKAEKRERDLKKKALRAEDAEDGEWEKVKGGSQVAKEKARMFPKDTEITLELVYKKLKELTAGRGKKATNRTELIELLTELRGISNKTELGDPIECQIVSSIIAALFDYNPSVAASMKPAIWESCMEHIDQLLTLLIKNKETIIMKENVEDDISNYTGEPPFRVRGCILRTVETMDDEYIKMLQACDAHSTEYIDRLKDEVQVCKLIETLFGYFEEGASPAELCRIYLKKIEHMYYKFDHISMKRRAGEPLPEGTEKQEDNSVVMDRLCKYIYAKDMSDLIRTRAILCHIYHHAMHDRLYEARDLMLMSHLQDNIQHSDIPTQIMYNRAMVQLGLCAFRQGIVKDAHSCLVDIQSSGRAKELLAQGLLLQRQHERTPEQEKIEKRRQMPYHMHINLELLECVYLVSAMLQEIPYMAAHEYDARRRMISKNFNHVMRMSDRMTLIGPPESMREHVVAASKAMKTGNWKACTDFLVNEKMNSKVWDLFYDAERVRVMMIDKVKEESLRTYLFKYSAVYDSLSITTLGDMFGLDRPTVHSIISKMIINEELMGSLDEPTKSVIMHRTEPTRLQSLALQLSEKVSSLMENNEKLVEMKQGGFYQRGGGGYQGGDRRGGYNKDGQRGGYKGNRDNYNNRGDNEGGYRGRGGYRGGRGGYRGGRGGGNRDYDGGGGGGGYRGGRGGGNRDYDGGGYRGGRGGGNRDYDGRRNNQNRDRQDNRQTNRYNY